MIPPEEGIATHSSMLAWRIPMDRGAWRATVHGIAKSQTPRRDSLSHTHTHTHTQVMVMILVTGDDDSFTERVYTAGGTRVRLGMGTGGRGAGTPCAAGPPEAPAVAASGMGICNSLALIFKLLEFCSSAPPNLGEVRHMESREQC